MPQGAVCYSFSFALTRDRLDHWVGKEPEGIPKGIRRRGMSQQEEREPYSPEAIAAVSHPQ